MKLLAALRGRMRNAAHASERQRQEQDAEEIRRRLARVQARVRAISPPLDRGWRA